MSEEGTPADVVDAAYEFLSFAPGTEPNWEGFNACFEDLAVLALRVFPGDAQVSVLALADYAKAQMRPDLKEEGYSETPGEREVDVVGSVAVVRQNFTMNFVGRPPQSAVDIFSLAFRDGRWRVVSVVSDMVRATPLRDVGSDS